MPHFDFEIKTSLEKEHTFKVEWKRANPKGNQVPLSLFFLTETFAIIKWSCVFFSEISVYYDGSVHLRIHCG